MEPSSRGFLCPSGRAGAACRAPCPVRPRLEMTRKSSKHSSSPQDEAYGRVSKKDQRHYLLLSGPHGSQARVEGPDKGRWEDVKFHEI